MILWSMATRENKNLLNNLNKTKQFVWRLFNLFILWLPQEFSAPIHVPFGPRTSRDWGKPFQIWTHENGLDCFRISFYQCLPARLHRFTNDHVSVFIVFDRSLSEFYCWWSRRINQKYVAVYFKCIYLFSYVTMNITL